MIFVDTGAWFAIAVANDPDHEAAMSWLRRNQEPLITTDYVLAEIATLIRMRDKTARGHRLAGGLHHLSSGNNLPSCKMLWRLTVRRRSRYFGIIQITCLVLSTAQVSPLWNGSESSMPLRLIVISTSTAASFGYLARITHSGSEAWSRWLTMVRV